MFGIDLQTKFHRRVQILGEFGYLIYEKIVENQLTIYRKSELSLQSDYSGYCIDFYINMTDPCMIDRIKLYCLFRYFIH